MRFVTTNTTEYYLKDHDDVVKAQLRAHIEAETAKFLAEGGEIKRHTPVQLVDQFWISRATGLTIQKIKIMLLKKQLPEPKMSSILAKSGGSGVLYNWHKPLMWDKSQVKAAVTERKLVKNLETINWDAT